MTFSNFTAPSRGRFTLRRIVALLAVAALAVLLAGCGGGGGKPQTTTGTTTGTTPVPPPSLSYPSNWQKLTAKQIKSLGPSAITAIKEPHGRALVIVRYERPLTKLNPSKLATQLDSEYSSRVKGFRRLTADLITTKAGRVFYYAYTAKAGGLHTIVLIPGTKRSYLIDAVTNPHDKTVSTELAHIIHSFVP